QTFPYLPAGVHDAIVDPGVGTAPRPVAISAPSSIFIRPDNGLLSWAVAAAGWATHASQRTNGELWLHPVAATLHGRDSFAPVAAGELVAYTGSARLISLAVNAGDAAERLGLPPGAHVRLSVTPAP